METVSGWRLQICAISALREPEEHIRLAVGETKRAQTLRRRLRRTVCQTQQAVGAAKLQADEQPARAPAHQHLRTKDISFKQIGLPSHPLRKGYRKVRSRASIPRKGPEVAAQQRPGGWAATCDAAIRGEQEQGDGVQRVITQKQGRLQLGTGPGALVSSRQVRTQEGEQRAGLLRKVAVGTIQAKGDPAGGTGGESDAVLVVDAVETEMIVVEAEAKELPLGEVIGNFRRSGPVARGVGLTEAGMIADVGIEAGNEVRRGRLVHRMGENNPARGAIHLVVGDAIDGNQPCDGLQQVFGGGTPGAGSEESSPITVVKQRNSWWRKRIEHRLLKHGQIEALTGGAARKDFRAYLPNPRYLRTATVSI